MQDPLGSSCMRLRFEIEISFWEYSARVIMEEDDLMYRLYIMHEVLACTYEERDITEEL